MEQMHSENVNDAYSAFYKYLVHVVEDISENILQQYFPFLIDQN